MPVKLDWLGCATFRLTVDDLVIFLDAYIDRVPSAPAVGLSATDVDRADYILIGHSHFDHIAGAEVIAQNTGAQVIASNESARVLRKAGIPEQQLLRSQGGERHGLGAGVSVRVFPSLHSCLWAETTWHTGEALEGHVGLTEKQRAGVRVGEGRGSIGHRLAAPQAQGMAEVREHLSSGIGSRDTGGPLAFLIETPYGSLFYHDTSGCWTGLVRELRPDVALVAMAGRPNVDGEPHQGSQAQFVGAMAKLLRPRTLLLGHHDDWMPPATVDMSTPEAIAPVRAELADVAPRTELVTVGYLEGTPLLG